MWLGGITVACRTYDDQEVVSLTPGWVAIKWLVLEWVTVCRDGKPCQYITHHQGLLSLPSLRGR